ncbi:solute carrier family 22 member 6-A [Biomphalaria pfeifferi]|uniref:Solute carrier family 22 member 6-A n=1 Tax=Biomphalaria pfeifferi TaxID=112525 RepID=A0AAD8F5K0_BIOPF|nr:solute carrier family 22 member 6-A [Biomphalaria pfeifferi]
MSNSSSLPFEISYTQCSVDVRNGSDLIFTSSCRDGYEYNVSMTSSFVCEWNLVCNEESFSDISQTVLVLGEMFGSLFLTRFADRHGRKVSFIATSLLFLAANRTCAVSPNFIFYLVFRFITGLSVATCYQLSYILVIEMMPTAHRALPEKLCSFLWSISLLSLCLVAYLTRVELALHPAVLVPFRHLCDLPVVPQWLQNFAERKVTDESIRWLCAVKRYKEVDDLVKKIARISQVDPQEGVFKLYVYVFVDSLVYDGLLLISSNLNDDFYLGFLLGVVTEIGRKKCTSLFHIVAGIFILVSTLILNTPLYDMIPGQYWSCLVLALLGRLSVTAGFSTTLPYVSELFPTSVRNASVALYLGSTIAPYSRTITRHVPWAPNVVFGIMYLTVTLAILFLPETCGHELAQTVKDMDHERHRRNQ